MFLPQVLLLTAFIAGNFAEEDDDRPVWDVITPCNIPNEATQGICIAPQDCPAYQAINKGQDLSSVGRLGFIRALQCPNENETMICCPKLAKASYRNPELSIDVPRRVRNSTAGVVSRLGEDDDECGVQTFQNKIKGSLTEIDEFPWAALLFYRNDYKGCGGVLISRNYVLTAAHCLAGGNYERHGPLAFVRLREYNLYTNPDCMVMDDGLDCSEDKLDVRPRSIKLHPSYQPDSVQQHHDIALIELAQPVRYSDFLRPICLPEPNLEPGLQQGKILSVCGWGRTDLFNVDMSSPIKMKASLPFVEQSRCGELYRSQALSLVRGQICAGGRKDKDSCAGDSGSPLMYYDRREAVWVLSGVVSRGTSTCGTVDRPGIYTNVREYLPWIKKTARL
uniref:CLIP domain-containing serine protease n=1 Tax=Culex tarsalis TaxID=7177 RepID=A0A1Q3FFC3_CULTA